jgi:hypothetical protein
MKKWTNNILIVFFSLVVLLSPFNVSINIATTTGENISSQDTVLVVSKSFAQANIVIGEEGAAALKKDAEKPGYWSRVADVFISKMADLTLSVLYSVLYALFVMSSFLVYLSGAIFNLSIFLSISQIKELLPDPAIRLTWTVFRDIANTLFVFLLLYAGIQTIVGNAKSSIQKIITWTIISAIFVNFSLFLTKSLVDVSNIVSLGIYNKIIVDSDIENNKPSTGYTLATTNALSQMMNSSGGGLAGSYVKAFEVTSTLKPLENKEGSANLVKEQYALIIRLAASIFGLLSASALMLASGLMFLARFVFVILLMIGSPLFFIGLAFPQFVKLKDFWQKHLVKNLVFPPVFFILIYISISLITSLNVSIKAIVPSVGAPGDVATFTTITFQMVLASLLSILFLGIPLLLSKMFGDIAGFKAVEKMSQKPFGALRAGRNLGSRIGGIGKRAVGSQLSKRIGGAASAVENHRFIRNNRLVQGNKYGRAFLASTTGKLQTTKIGGGRSYKEDEQKKIKDTKEDDQFTKRQLFEENSKTHAVDAAVKSPAALGLTQGQPGYDQALTDYTEAQTRVRSTQQYVQEMGVDDMKANKKDFEDNKNGITQHLTDKNLSAMEKDDELKDTAKKVHEKRLEKLTGLLKVSPPDKKAVAGEFDKIPEGSLAKLSVGQKLQIAEVAGHKMKGDKLKKISEDLTPELKKEIGDRINTFFQNPNNGEDIKGFKPEDVAKLSKDTLEKDHIIKNLKQNQVKAVLESADDTTLKNKIKSEISNDQTHAAYEYIKFGTGKHV